MGCPTPYIGDKTKDFILFHLSGIGWGKVMGDYNDLFLYMREPVMLLPYQVSKDPFPYLLYITLPRPQVLILYPVKYHGKVVHMPLQRPFRSDKPFPDVFYSVINQHLVFKDKEVGVYDVDMLLGALLEELLLYPLEL